MKLIALQPGITVEEVLENTGFELFLAENLEENSPPSPEELQILRDEVDKDKFYI